MMPHRATQKRVFSIAYWLWGRLLRPSEKQVLPKIA
jgi:hypothetical protein